MHEEGRAPCRSGSDGPTGSLLSHPARLSVAVGVSCLGEARLAILRSSLAGSHGRGRGEERRTNWLAAPLVDRFGCLDLVDLVVEGELRPRVLQQPPPPAHVRQPARPAVEIVVGTPVLHQDRTFLGCQYPVMEEQARLLGLAQRRKHLLVDPRRFIAALPLGCQELDAEEGEAEVWVLPKVRDVGPRVAGTGWRFQVARVAVRGTHRMPPCRDAHPVRKAVTDRYSSAVPDTLHRPPMLSSASRCARLPSAHVSSPP